MRHHRGLAALLLAALVTACAPNESTESRSPSASPGAAPLPLVVDTDMAPDDVVALASLLRDPAVDIRAILVDGTGEAHCPGGMFVARSVVTMLAEREIPVACGRATPLGEAEPFPEEWRAGADIANGITLASPSYLPESRPAEELLLELAATEAASGGRLSILTLGTLTNIAGALELDPQLPDKVRIVSMLGAVGVPGNVETQNVAEPTAEWNAHADPTAVARVLAGGFDLTLIPLDATNDVPLTRDLFSRLEADHAAGPADLAFEIYARNPFMLEGGFYLWDPLASAALRDPSIVSTRAANVRVVEGAGPDGGRLIEDAGGAATTVATSADRGRFEAFLLDRLRIGAPREGAFDPQAKVTVTIGESSCDASLGAGASPGLMRIDVRNQATEPRAVVAFALGSVPWADVVAFIEELNRDPEAVPPPVAVLAFVNAEAGAEAAAFADVPAGLLGFSCVRSEAAPDAILAGPYQVGP